MGPLSNEAQSYLLVPHFGSYGSAGVLRQAIKSNQTTYSMMARQYLALVCHYISCQAFHFMHLNLCNLSYASHHICISHLIICIIVYTYKSYQFIISNFVCHFIYIMLGIFVLYNSTYASQHMHLSILAYIISLYASQSMHIVLII